MRAVNCHADGRNAIAPVYLLTKIGFAHPHVVNAMIRPAHDTVGQPALHVLLVDDDAFLLELMVEILNDMRVASIQIARSGLEGLAVYRSSPQRPNVIVCDLCMPQLGGMEFLGQLAKERAGADIFIISGHNRTPPNDPNWGLATYDGPVLHLAEKMARLQGLRVRGTFEKPITREVMAHMVQLLANPVAASTS
jgi:CheY-like chemotaxis protein